MRRAGLVTIATVLVAVACNSIVGVEDVKPVKGTGPQTTSSGSSGGSSGGKGPLTPLGDDDDDVQAGKTDSGTLDKDTGTSGTPECNGAVDCERLIFVTRAAFTGKLGGLAGADQKCFEAAKKIPTHAGRAFRAWLSDSTTNVSARIPKGTKFYRRTDDSVVAVSFADLTDGTLNLPPALDEEGKPLGGSITDHGVWTASDNTGKYNDDGCSDWNNETSSFFGVYGDSTATTGDWTAIVGEGIPAIFSCSVQFHLYCIEY